MVTLAAQLISSAWASSPEASTPGGETAIRAAAESVAHAPDAGLTLSLALAVGVISIALARHLRIPSIVILLAAGVLLGPDLANIIRPADMADAMHSVIGFAVAIILFEGGMNLQIKRLRKQSRVIQSLITVGAFVTTVGGALTAHYLLQWDWRTSILFGTLVIVTGPTVITPLLRRVRVKRSVETILEAEGILIDAVGAVTAVVAVQIALSPSMSSIAEGAVGFASRIGLGVGLGLLGGLIIARMLKDEKIIPEGLENIFTLSMVLALFAISNQVVVESGIVTVIMAGLVVGNLDTRVKSELLEFKEQLTMMMIGMLFVLLAADVRISDVVALGWPGLLTVVVLMLVVRPVGVFLCTLRSQLTWKERTFIAWLGPRGIIAAAVAALFADTLSKANLEGGRELRALVFLVIAVTVGVQGLSGGFVAGLLGLRRKVGEVFAILGANPLSRALAIALRDYGREIVFIESNPEASRAAQEEGFRVVFGNGFEESTLLRAQLDTKAAVLAATSNDKVNLFFARRARAQFKASHLYIAGSPNEHIVTDRSVEESGGHFLYGGRCDVELWSVRVRRNTAAIEHWFLPESGSETAVRAASEMIQELENALLPLAVQSGRRVRPVDNKTTFEKDDKAAFLVFNDRKDEVRQWLIENGWSPFVEEAEASEDATGAETADKLKNADAVGPSIQQPEPDPA